MFTFLNRFERSKKSVSDFTLFFTLSGNGIFSDLIFDFGCLSLSEFNLLCLRMFDFQTESLHNPFRIDGFGNFKNILDWFKNALRLFDFGEGIEFIFLFFCERRRQFSNYLGQFELFGNNTLEIFSHWDFGMRKRKLNGSLFDEGESDKKRSEFIDGHISGILNCFRIEGIEELFPSRKTFMILQSESNKLGVEISQINFRSTDSSWENIWNEGSYFSSVRKSIQLRNEGNEFSYCRQIFFSVFLNIHIGD